MGVLIKQSREKKQATTSDCKCQRLNQAKEEFKQQVSKTITTCFTTRRRQCLKLEFEDKKPNLREDILDIKFGLLESGNGLVKYGVPTTTHQIWMQQFLKIWKAVNKLELETRTVLWKMKAWVIFFNAFTHASTSINRSKHLVHLTQPSIPSKREKQSVRERKAPTSCERKESKNVESLCGCQVHVPEHI